MSDKIADRDYSEIDVYRELQEHIDGFPIGFPPTKSGVELRILKHLFTPEEAKIGTLIKFSWDDPEPLESIYERAKPLGYTIEELEIHLDNMAKKGAIAGIKEGGKKLYCAASLIIGMFEFQVNKLTRDFIKDLHQYLKEGYGMEMIKTQISQQRTIPVEKSIDRDLTMSSYEELGKIIDNAEGPLMAMDCVCRQAQDILNKPCKATSRREVCLGIGKMSRIYLDQGIGRQISKEEALEILQENQSEGLILQTGNNQKADFVCSCCTCCCEGLWGINRFPNPADLVTTNHYAEIESDLCTGCETCIDICQLGALTLDDDISVVNRKRCIGCGNCVANCPSEAIKLRKKDKEYIPPLTGTELYNKIGERKDILKERELKHQLRKEKRM